MFICIHRFIEHLSDHAIKACKVRYRSTLETYDTKGPDTAMSEWTRLKASEKEILETRVAYIRDGFYIAVNEYPCRCMCLCQ